MSADTPTFDPRRARTKQPLPLWMDAFLRDTMLLQADEFGVYIRLLAAMWANVDLCLPDDDRRLAICGGVSLRLWKHRIGPTIRPLLQTSDGIIYSRKLREVALTTERYLASRSGNRADYDAKSARHAKPTGTRKPYQKDGEKNDKSLETINTINSHDTSHDGSHDQSCVTPSNIPIDSSSSAGACARDLGFLEEAPDPLLRRVAEAVGLSGAELPRFWVGDQAATHVRAWLSAHGLTEDEVVAEAARSQSRFDGPPDGPKALDRWMEQAGAAKRSASGVRSNSPAAAPAKPPTSPIDRLSFYADWIKDMSKSMPPSTISNTLRDALLSAKMVTPEDLRARGIR